MKNKKGFTLIEIIITIALLALIGTIITINMVGLNKKEQEKERTRIKSIVGAAAEAYLEVEGKTIKENDYITIQFLINNNYLKKSTIPKEYYKGCVLKATDGSYKVYLDTSNCTNIDNEAAKDKMYTLTYYKNDNTKLQSQTIKKGNTMTIITTPETKTGHSFVGWLNNKEGKIYKPNKSLTIRKNYNLYPKWKKNKYIINYNANKGMNAPSHQQGEYETKVKLSNTKPTRKGYKFLGWSLSKNAITAQYYPSDYYKITAQNVTLYAVWEKEEFAVKIKLDVKNKMTDYPDIYFNNQKVDIINDEVLLPKIDKISNYSFHVEAAPATKYSNISCQNVKVKSNVLGLNDENGDEFLLSEPTKSVECTLSYYKNDQILINSLHDYDFTSFYTSEWKKNNKTVIDFETVNLNSGEYEIDRIISYLQPWKKKNVYDYYFTESGTNGNGSTYWTGFYLHGIANNKLEIYSNTRWSPCGSACYSHELVNYDLSTGEKNIRDSDGPVDNDTSDNGYFSWPTIAVAPYYTNGETDVSNEVKEQFSYDKIDAFLKISDSRYVGNKSGYKNMINVCFARKNGFFDPEQDTCQKHDINDDIYYFKNAETGQYGVVVLYKILDDGKVRYNLARITHRDLSNNGNYEDSELKYFVYNNHDNYEKNKYVYNSENGQGTGKYYKMIYVLDVTKEFGQTSFIKVNPYYYSDGTRLTVERSSYFNHNLYANRNTIQADYTFFVHGNFVNSQKAYWWVFNGGSKNSPIIYAMGSNGIYLHSSNEFLKALQQEKFWGMYRNQEIKFDNNVFE